MSIIYALWLRNIKNFSRDRVRLIISVIIPFFFIYVFSSIFRSDQVDNPAAFMLGGVLIVTVFQTSLSIATTTIDDMLSGFMKEVLVSPAGRLEVAIGQLLSAATIASFQGLLILIVGLFTNLRFENWLTPFYVLGAMILVGLVFSGLGLFLASKVQSAQTFQIVQQAIVLPLTFLSGAYIPLALLPTTMRYFAYINPMTYTTAFFRTIVLEKSNLPLDELIQTGLAINLNGIIVQPWMSGVIIVIFGLFFLFLATNSFVNADFSKFTRMTGNQKRISRNRSR